MKDRKDMGRHEGSETRLTAGLSDFARPITITTISAILLISCYTFVPLSVIWAAKMAPVQFYWFVAILLIPGIWFAPAVAALISTSIIEHLTGISGKNMENSWIIGIIGGAIILTIIWMVPFLNGIFPSVVDMMQRLGISPIFSDRLFAGLSWLVCVPMMVYANLVGITGGREQTSSKTKKKSRQKYGEGDAVITTDDELVDQQASDWPHGDGKFTYDWGPAPDTTFKDVGGQKDAKRQVGQSVVRPLNSLTEAYERFNVSAPNGILLYGPPGTGKSLFARAIAGELGHPYLELSAGDIKSRWINKSTEQVNRLFAEAEQFDRCVIFIDEIDALLAGREGDQNQEHTQVVNEFLAHLDADDPNYLIIAATNRPDLLDEAATRRGRFDQQYEIGLPDTEARAEIFRVQLRDRPTALEDEDYSRLARETEGLTSADIVGIVEDAAMSAAEADAEAITLDHLLQSTPDINES